MRRCWRSSGPVSAARVSNSKCAQMLQAPLNSQLGGTSMASSLTATMSRELPDVLTEIRGSRSNSRASVVFAVVNGTTSVSTAVDAGANFVLGKPVQDSPLESLLDVALPRMAREHRRYFRHKVDLPVEVLCYAGTTLAGKLVNVSEDGLALTHFGPAAVEGVVTVQFGLPSAKPQTFQAKAAVVWNDASAMGLRFLRIEPASRSCFGAWLDSLEAQLQFRESAQSTNAASKRI